LCQVATADLSEIVSLYKVMPYADGDVKKHAKIAYRFTIDNEEETEGTTSREVFYVGEVTLNGHGHLDEVRGRRDEIPAAPGGVL
jgi:uncharacterized protein (DUF1015 family)